MEEWYAFLDKHERLVNMLSSQRNKLPKLMLTHHKVHQEVQTRDELYAKSGYLEDVGLKFLHLGKRELVVEDLDDVFE